MDAIADVASVDSRSERIWPKVEVQGDCWAWTGAVASRYGTTRNNGPAGRRCTVAMTYAFLHFFHLEKSNAAFHCSDVRFSPLTFRLQEILYPARSSLIV